MRKVFSLLTLVAILFAVQASTIHAQQGKVKVRFWYGLGGQPGEIMKAQVAKFNASQSAAEVELVFQQSYAGVQQKFQAALVGGDLPELVQLEIHSTPQFALQGALTPLDTFFANDTAFNFADFFPASLISQRIEGKLYGLPINRSTPVMYFNKDMFKAAGLDPAKPPKTWSEFRDAAQKLAKTENGELKVAGFDPQPETWYFEAMVWGNGGDFASADLKSATFAQPGAEILQLWADMIYKDKTARLVGGENAGEQRRQNFIQGRSAMFFASTGAVAGLLNDVKTFEWMTAFVPGSDGKQPGIPTGGATAGIPAKISDDRKQAAWEFLKWFTSPEQAASWSEQTGYFPVRQSAVDTLTKKGYYDKAPQYKTAVDQLVNARQAPLTGAWPAISDVIAKGMEEVLINNVPALDAMTRAQQKSTDLLNQ